MKIDISTSVKKTAWFTATGLCLVMMGLFLAYGCDKPNGTGDGTPIVDEDSSLIIQHMDSSVWKFEYEYYLHEYTTTIVLTFYPSINKVRVQSTPEFQSPDCYLLGGNYIEDYRVVDDRLCIAENGKFYDSGCWEITFPSENEIHLLYLGIHNLLGGFFLKEYEFICQTEFKGI